MYIRTQYSSTDSTVTYSWLGTFDIYFKAKWLPQDFEISTPQKK